MQVQIRGMTQPIGDDLPAMTPEEFIVYMGRVSNPENQANVETSERLLRRLLREGHWSPFDMVDVIVEIHTTRDISRQILRHRSFVFQEFSQRYASVLSLGFARSEARLQDKKNRQSSIEVTDPELHDFWAKAQDAVLALAESTYVDALSRGIAKEVARKLLPEGLTMSRMYMKGSIRSWIHYYGTRNGNGTQKEHQQVAVAVLEALRPYFPVITEIMETKEEGK
jgi:thymidylate synthase (FAD)